MPSPPAKINSSCFLCHPFFPPSCKFGLDLIVLVDCTEYITKTHLNNLFCDVFINFSHSVLVQAVQESLFNNRNKRERISYVEIRELSYRARKRLIN